MNTSRKISVSAFDDIFGARRGASNPSMTSWEIHELIWDARAHGEGMKFAASLVNDLRTQGDATVLLDCLNNNPLEPVPFGEDVDMAAYPVADWLIQEITRTMDNGKFLTDYRALWSACFADSSNKDDYAPLAEQLIARGRDASGKALLRQLSQGDITQWLFLAPHHDKVATASHLSAIVGPYLYTHNDEIVQFLTNKPYKLDKECWKAFAQDWVWWQDKHGDYEGPIYEASVFVRENSLNSLT